MWASIPKKSLRNLIIFTGALAVVIGLMVVPSYFAIGKAEAKRAKISKEVNEQRQLAPVFGQLVKKRRELNASNADLPERTALQRDAAGGVADTLTGMAGSARLQMAGVTADLNALVSDVRLMRVDLVLRGKLMDYRNFLDQLIAVPHVEFIERLRIMSIPEGREYRMRVWIALQ